MSNRHDNSQRQERQGSQREKMAIIMRANSFGSHSTAQRHNRTKPGRIDRCFNCHIVTPWARSPGRCQHPWAYHLARSAYGVWILSAGLVMKIPGGIGYAYFRAVSDGLRRSLREDGESTAVGICSDWYGALRPVCRGRGKEVMW